MPSSHRPSAANSHSSHSHSYLGSRHSSHGSRYSRSPRRSHSGSDNASTALTSVSRNPRRRHAATHTSALQFHVGSTTSSTGYHPSAMSTERRLRSHPSATVYSGTTAYIPANNVPLGIVSPYTGYTDPTPQYYPILQGNRGVPNPHEVNNPGGPAVQEEAPSIRWMINGIQVTENVYTRYLSTGQVPSDLPPQMPYIPNSQHPVPISVRDPYRDYTGPIVRGNPREFHGIQQRLTASGGSGQVLGNTYGNMFSQLGDIGQYY